MLLSMLNEILQYLADHHGEHARDTRFYRFNEAVAKFAFHEAKETFASGKPITLGELGEIILPYEKMGAIDSLDLFGLDELLMFSFYLRNRDRYRRVVDIGANIGLHSILLAKCGYDVEAWEPDPNHFEKLMRNVALNGVADRVRAHCAAVSDHVGRMEFVRVLGNTTSSHLAGAKANPYGELERFPVDLHDFKDIASRADLAKIDAEGHEGTILTAIPLERWNSLDAFVEIGSEQTAQQLLAHFAHSPVRLFVQKLNWNPATQLEEMPKSYRDGSVFITSKPVMPW